MPAVRPLQPIMVVGNVVCLVSAVMFGLAGSYPMAVLARVVGALPNGILGGESLACNGLKCGWVLGSWNLCARASALAC